MPIHCCLDPQDPYAEREVRVAFAWTEAGPHLITALDAQNGTHIQVVERKNQNIALDTAITMLTMTHDYFLLQLAFEPQSGTLVFMGYGLYGSGTTAAGWFFQNILLPNKSSYTDRYYVFEWTDTDQTPGPSGQDTYTQMASGK